MTGRPFALLFCRKIRLPFYRRLGWRRVGPEVSVEQEHELMTMPLLTCWFSFESGLHRPIESPWGTGPTFLSGDAVGFWITLNAAVEFPVSAQLPTVRWFEELAGKCRHRARSECPIALTR
jgi:hypothetical protein